MSVLFDLCGLTTRPGRYGQPELQCPTCARWRPSLVLDGSGRFACGACRRHEAEAAWQAEQKGGKV